MLFKKNSTVLLIAIGLALICILFTDSLADQSLPYKTISTPELKSLFDSNAKDFMVIDTRGPDEYQDVHIPGAVNIPQKKFFEYSHLLPHDKATRLIFYCNGFK